MPYIGNPIYQSAFVTDQFSGTGSQTAYTMSVAPAGTTNVLVVVSGVVQDPSTYGVVGNTLTFSAAPPSGTGNISCRYLGVPVTGVTTTAYRTVTEFTATASQTTFTPPSYTVGYIQVYRNGVLLGSADYTATNGTTVVLASGATVGDLVTTISFYVSSVLNAIPNSPASVNSSNIVAGVSLSSPTFTGTATLPAGVANSFGLGLGTAVPSSGIGIAFPATASDSTNANTLDDYEEGTFTPFWGGAASNPTLSYDFRQGQYTKIGNCVYFSIRMGISSGSGSGGSGQLTLGGLPFTIGSSINDSMLTIGMTYSWGSVANAPVYALTNPGSTYAFIYGGSPNANTTTTVASVQSGGGRCWITGFYYTT